MVHTTDVTDVALQGDGLTFKFNTESVTISIEDVIGCQRQKPSSSYKHFLDCSPSASAYVLYIANKTPEFIWTLGILNIMGDNSRAETLVKSLQGKLAKLKRPKNLLVFINPIGGKQTAKTEFLEVIAPLLDFADVAYQSYISERANHMIELVLSADVTTIDGIIVLGGDGTLGQVINALIQKHQGSDSSRIKTVNPIEIPIGIIPTGTGNMVCKTLHGTRDLTTSVLHVIKGGVLRTGLKGVYSDGRFVGAACWSVAYGLFSDMTHYVDKYRSWLRQLKGFVIPFWFLLFKTRRLFNAKITCKTRGSDGNGDKERTAQDVNKGKTQEIESCYSILTSCITNIVDESGKLNKPDTMFRQNFFNLFTYVQCPILGLLKHFFQLITDNPCAFKFDFVDVYDVTEYTVDIQTACPEKDFGQGYVGATRGKHDDETDDGYLSRVVNLDGEMFEMVDKKYSVRYHQDVCLYYHSK